MQAVCIDACCLLTMNRMADSACVLRWMPQGAMPTTVPAGISPLPVSQSWSMQRKVPLGAGGKTRRPERNACDQMLHAPFQCCMTSLCTGCCGMQHSVRAGYGAYAAESLQHYEAIPCHHRSLALFWTLAELTQLCA